jgi:hypothetical protein
VPYRQGNVFARFAKAARLFAEVDRQAVYTTTQSLELLRHETVDARSAGEPALSPSGLGAETA